jgi:drug/metabolite transporter (DMT)-like permease
MRISTSGWTNGLIGVLLFSGSMPATRAAVAGFTPLFLTGARALIAAALGAMLLAACVNGARVAAICCRWPLWRAGR